MLKSFFFSYLFHRCCQSGYYLDFFLKKFSEVFIKNIYVYSSQFIGEKYIIEELTRKFFEKVLWRINKYIGVNKLFYSVFFIQLITFLFFLLSTIFFLF